MISTRAKYIIGVAAAIVVGASAFFYIQYRKLMNYTIKPKSVKITKLSANKIAMNVYLNFVNKSTLAFDIIEQEYKVYMNKRFVSDVVNYSKNHIKAKSTSLIGVNVQFDPSRVIKLLGSNALDILLNPEKVIIRVDMKLKVSLYGIKISIPYTMEDTLKNLKSEEAS